MNELHVCESFTCCGTPLPEGRVQIDPDAPHYQVVTGPGVNSQEVAPGLTVLWAADDE